MAKKEEKNIKDKTSFIKGFKAELKKVVWPTPKQLLNSTIAVLTIVIITALIVFVLDFAFESFNKYGIDKIKEVVTNSTSNQISNSEDNVIDAEDSKNEVSSENVLDNSIVENDITE